MEQKERKGCGWFSALIIGLCVVGSCGLLAFGLSHFRSGGEHTMSATGSASVSFESDTIIWRGSFIATDFTSKEAYKKIKSDADLVKKYLKENGLTDEEVVFNSVDISQTFDDVYDGNGNFVKSTPTGYKLSQSVTITSKDLDKVEKISRDISSLLDQGVEFTSDSPEYYYSDLESIKLDLIDKASKNAKDRIDIIAKNTNANIGKLKKSSLGVFQITAQNSGTSDYSYDGAFDQTSRFKTATITVKLEYDLK
ncbi:SIMPL domain-containing protein [Butyrivibrio sp. NC3005]|uniref:SIMPL domain-containing protein n=1 Tax=Butyrivibrio sp. NC3005 TaxID=1280685 RepID=UPI0004259DE0|nr:SIMPL domain-containing protein [Butyrivibrio sp. NC3005]